MTGPVLDRRGAIAAGAGAMLLLPCASGAAPEPAPKLAPTGRDQPFDDGWRFRRGEAEGLEAPAVDDSDWRRVDLPHDWSIEDVPGGPSPDRIGPFDRKAIGGTATGFTVGGEGWYRKHFRVDHPPTDARVIVEFDGVSVECETWVNGVSLGHHDHGYAPFWFDLTPHLVHGGDNILALRVRNLGKNSRWYAGSGIYRQVRLHVVPAGTRLAQWGVAAWTRRIAAGAAEVEVTSRIEAPAPAATLVTRLRDPAGRIVAEASAPAGGEIRQRLSVRGARLWSPADPLLHSLESELHHGGKVVDRLVQPFGIRIITVDTARGIAINGQRLVLRGGCIHHDNGLLGACAYPQADERRIALLKARGYNAIRSAHNPASRSLREACDRLGMLLLDEAFDMWHVAKLPQDYSRHFPDDWHNVVEAMVRSARNSASVFMWSIGNEIPARSTPEGVHWEWLLANAVRRIDPTRPVTAALNGLLGPLLEASARAAVPGRAGQPDNASTIFLDAAGYNYRLEDFERDHAAHPARIMFATETFPKEAWDYVELTERAPYALGEFVWTALDYLGEAGIGGGGNIAAGAAPMLFAGWPWIVAWCGDLDLIGDQKAPSRFRDVAWGLSKLEVEVQRPIPEGKVEYISNWGWSDELPSWSWAGFEGRQMAVRLYTPGDRVVLFLNGAKMGEAAVTPADKLRAEIKVPYAPGTLEAVAFRDGREIARRRLETVGRPARLRLRAERPALGRDRRDLAFIGIEILDAAGRLIPEAERAISLAIEGPAELAGFGSGNPRATGSFQAPDAKSFRGRALAILRATGKAGAVRMSARSDGLEGAVVTLRVA